MEIIGNFPARGLIQKWLKAGVMEGQDFSPSVFGTPQGGIISPLLANIALHGMEEALGYRWRIGTNSRTATGTTAIQRLIQGKYDDRPVVKLVRYADDFVALGNTREDVEVAKTQLETFLAERGLEMSQEKTRITHIEEGFDFLGFHVRRIRTPRKKSGYSIYAWPSQKSEQAFRTKIRLAFRKARHQPNEEMTLRVNAIIRGWTNYFRIGTSRRSFEKLNNHVWYALWKYLRDRHKRMGRRALKRMYFPKGWKFQDPKTGIRLLKPSDTKIVRHRKVAHFHSPDDPALRGYWELRRKKSLEISKRKATLWIRQNGLCAHCQGELDTGEELQVHHVRGQAHDTLKDLQLLHEMCHQQITQLARVA
jgi:RNA-directed DNA polymerase